MTNIHKGHRARMRSRLEGDGLEGFSAHEVMELLLYFPLPLRNVNPLAHELISRFGSLSKVLTAGASATSKVTGVGKNTAEWLETLSSVVAYYQSQTLEDRPKIGSIREARKFGMAHLAGMPEDTVCVLLTNYSDNLLGIATTPYGYNVSNQQYITNIVRLAIRYHAKQVIIIRSEKKSRGTHIQKDVALAQKLDILFGEMGIYLKDDLLLTENSISSLRNTRMLNETNDAFADLRVRTREKWFV